MAFQTNRRQLETLTAEGFRPVNVSIVAPDDRPQVCAFYIKEKTESVVAPCFLTGDEFVRALQDNARAGRQLTHVNAVTYARADRFSAVFQQATTSGEARFKHGLTSGELFTELDSMRGTGYLTQALAGYEVDGEPAANPASGHNRPDRTRASYLQHLRRRAWP